MKLIVFVSSFNLSVPFFNLFATFFNLSGSFFNLSVAFFSVFALSLKVKLEIRIENV